MGSDRVATFAAAPGPQLQLADSLAPRMMQLQASATLPAPPLPGSEQLARLFPADAPGGSRLARQLPGAAGAAAPPAARWANGACSVDRAGCTRWPDALLPQLLVSSYTFHQNLQLAVRCNCVRTLDIKN